MRLDPSEPPPDLPYEDLDDWQARALLSANGVGDSEAEVLASLRAEDGNLRALAAHHLGTLGARDAVPALLVATHEDDEVVRVEAAWSLARLGEDSALQQLLDLAALPVEASVVPLKAAGYLARVGRPDGFAAVRDGLESENFLVRMTATRQLYFFVSLDRMPLADGTRVDVRELFPRALADDEEDVRWAARSQLEALGRDFSIEP